MTNPIIFLALIEAIQNKQKNDLTEKININDVVSITNSDYTKPKYEYSVKKIMNKPINQPRNRGTNHSKPIRQPKNIVC
tara:strand:- start:7 stop:243 length:237 start_codon:yes stop_codon:yes gene_type:complete